MGKAEQLRFYSASEYFRDDERVIAHAIPYFLKIDIDPMVVYRDLLGCKYKRWIDQIEQILDCFNQKEIDEFIEERQAFFILMCGNSQWGKDDFEALSKSAWKLIGEDDE